MIFSELLVDFSFLFTERKKTVRNNNNPYICSDALPAKGVVFKSRHSRRFCFQCHKTHHVFFIDSRMYDDINKGFVGNEMFAECEVVYYGAIFGIDAEGNVGRVQAGTLNIITDQCSFIE